MQYKSYDNRGNYTGLLILFFLFFGGFRLLLVLVGLVFAMLPLLILLGIVYFLLKAITLNTGISKYLQTQTKAHNQFIELFARASAHLIMIDGKVEEVEIQTFKNFFITNFHYQGAQLQWAEDLLQSEIRETNNLQKLVAEINIKFSYEVKLVLLELLYQIAFSDFEFHEKEKALIDEIASLLRINLEDKQSIGQRYYGKSGASDKEKYLAILGLQPKATATDIKNAYRKLVKQFHPDLVANLGSELKEYNQLKIREINEAYEKLEGGG